MSYVFPGIVQFADPACDAVGLVADASHDAVAVSAINDQRHRSKSGWHLKAVIDVASQLAGVIEASRQGLAGADAAKQAVARAELIIKGLEAQLAAAKAALAHAVDGTGLDVTPAAPDPAPVDPAPGKPVPATPQPAKVAAKK